MKGPYQGTQGLTDAQVAENAERAAAGWHMVDDHATWPAERYRADKGSRDYRIICDPDAKHINFPEDASGEWWILVVREKRQNGCEYLHFGAHRSPDSAMRSAEREWGGP